MQRAVLLPFPPLTSTPLSSLSEVQRLDTLIENLETHRHNVKAALLASSLSTLHALPDSTATTAIDPRLANRTSHKTHKDSHDALLASLKIPYKPGRVNSISNSKVPAKDKDRFLDEMGEALERLGGYERESKEVVDGLWRERESLRERERVEQDVKAGVYDKARDPRLRR